MTPLEIYIKIEAKRKHSLDDFKLYLRVGYENAQLQRAKKMKEWFDKEIEWVERESL